MGGKMYSLESLPMACAVLDGEGIVIDSNAVFVETMGPQYKFAQYYPQRLRNIRGLCIPLSCGRFAFPNAAASEADVAVLAGSVERVRNGAARERLSHIGMLSLCILACATA
jgi:hypothetical protein